MMWSKRELLWAEVSHHDASTARALPTVEPFFELFTTAESNRAHCCSQHLLMAGRFLQTAEHMSEPCVEERSFNACFNAPCLYWK